MIEQKRHPIDHRTIRVKVYSDTVADYRPLIFGSGIYALGRDQAEGRAFFYRSNLPDLHEALELIESQLDPELVVTGPGMNADLSLPHNRVIFDHQRVGIWVSGFEGEDLVLHWLKNKVSKRR